MKNFLWIGAVAVSMFLFFIGCGKGEAKISQQDTEPFKMAIQEYLKAKNYGMDVSSFDELSANGENASATCKLKEAEGMVNVKVTWEFSFEKKDGKWQVKNHTVK